MRSVQYIWKHLYSCRCKLKLTEQLLSFQRSVFIDLFHWLRALVRRTFQGERNSYANTGAQLKIQKNEEKFYFLEILGSVVHPAPQLATALDWPQKLLEVFVLQNSSSVFRRVVSLTIQIYSNQFLLLISLFECSPSSVFSFPLTYWHLRGNLRKHRCFPQMSMNYH